MAFSDLTAFLEHLTKELVPGCDVCVMQDHKVLYRHYAGMRDRENQVPMKGNEIYPLHSLSKLVTVVAAMQLFEKGLYRLNDSLSDYIPEYAHVQVLRKDGTVRDAEKPITVKHLFTMCAGFDYNVRDPFMTRVREETASRGCPTLEVIKALAGRPLSAEPGAEFRYSLCHDVLAALVEVLSGEKFRTYVQKNIFSPLGMINSSYHISDEMRPFMPRQYQWEADKAIPGGWEENRLTFGSEYDSGGGGVLSTVDDFRLFLDALACGGTAQDGTRILSPASIHMIKANQLTAEQAVTFVKKVLDGYSYGLGVRTAVDPVAGGFASPVGEFGWSGAAGAYALVDTENRLSITYAQNVIGMDECIIHLPIRNIVYASLG